MIQQICVVLSHWLCGNLLQQQKETHAIHFTGGGQRMLVTQSDSQSFYKWTTSWVLKRWIFISNALHFSFLFFLKYLFGSARPLLQHAASSLLCTGFSLVIPGLSNCSAWTWLPSGMWDLSSLTGTWTYVPCIGRQILDHWTTGMSLISQSWRDLSQGWKVICFKLVSVA